MASANFRKIDIDQYDEEVVQESELYDPDPRSATQVTSIAKEKSQQVRQLIGRSEGLAAIKLAVSQPPYGDAVEDAKNTTLLTVLEILNSTKSSEISPLVKALDVSEQDNLMKYIYKGLSKPEMGTSAVLLAWHEKLTEAAGTGCIVRVMSDRRIV